MKMGQQGETGGNDDSFWLSIDDGRDAMYAFGKLDATSAFVVIFFPKFF